MGSAANICEWWRIFLISQYVSIPFVILQESFKGRKEYPGWMDFFIDPLLLYPILSSCIHEIWKKAIFSLWWLEISTTRGSVVIPMFARLHSAFWFGIWQVYRAKMKDGNIVAVKVQRERVQGIIWEQLQNLLFFSDILERWFEGIWGLCTIRNFGKYRESEALRIEVHPACFLTTGKHTRYCLLFSDNHSHELVILDTNTEEDSPGY